MAILEEDQRLLRAYCREENESAFAQVVHRQMPLVYGLAYRDLRDHHLAEEVCQNVFVALAKAARKEVAFRSVGAWLLQVTRRQTAMCIRSEMARRRREQRVIPEEPSVMLDEASVWAKWVPELTDALAHLSERDQQALFLRYYEGRTHKEIATMLGIHERAAQKRTNRAIDRLRASFSRRGITIAAGMLGPQLFTAGAIPPPTSLAATIAVSASSGAVPVGSATLLSSLMNAFTSVKGLAVFSVITGILVAIPAARHWDFVKTRLLGAPSPRATSNDGSTFGQNGSTFLNPRGLAIDDIEGIYRLEPAEREPRLTKLVRYLQWQEDDAYLADLFTRWTALDPPRIARESVTMFRAKPDDEAHAKRFGRLMEIPIRGWLNGDTEAAQDWVSALVRKDYAEAYAFEAVLGWYAGRDRDAAYQWLIGRPYNRERAFDLLADSLTSPPVVESLNWLGSISVGDDLTYDSNLEGGPRLRREGQRPKIKLFAAAIPKLFEKDRNAVCDWLADQPASPSTSEAIASVSRYWAHADPAAACEWALAIENAEERERATSKVAATWAEADPSAAFQWATTLAEESLKWGAAHDVLNAWMKSSPKQDELLEAMRPLANEPSAFKVHASLADWLPLKEGLPWIQSLPMNANRQHAAEHLFYRFGQTDVDEGIRLLLEAKSVEYEGAKGLALGWLTAGGRDALATWQETLSPESPSLAGSVAAEASMIGAFDPRMIAPKVLALPESRWRDWVIVELIDRTCHRCEEACDLAHSWSEELHDSSMQRQASQKIQLARRNLKERPSGTVLPDVARSPVSIQPLNDLRKQLAALATMPLRDS